MPGLLCAHPAHIVLDGKWPSWHGRHTILIEIIGFVAAAISFGMFIPQARTVWLNRGNRTALRGVSAGTQYLLLANASLWGIYAVLTGAFWSGAPGLFNGPLAILILVELHRSRKAAPADECGHEGDHLIFITAPPGYGNILPCTPERAKHGVAIPARPKRPAPAEA